MRNEDILGLNVKKGLSAISNNKKMYIKLLKSFIVNNYCDQLLDAIGRADSEQIMKKAHTLKGVAGNLHMTGIYELSNGIETDARAGKPVPAAGAQVEGLISAYKTTVESINMIIQNPGILDEL